MKESILASLLCRAKGKIFAKLKALDLVCRIGSAPMACALLHRWKCYDFAASAVSGRLGAALLGFRRLLFSLCPVGFHSLGLSFALGGTEASSL